ncbi:2'-5' RNA ligase family protein [Haloplanus sp. C73]|uniref:2'-5' RNA ligase family protein n=1 Tax=Haloplanus sp. C73 TaxID=3421641 RepID=UPI003EB9B010
MYSLNVPVPGTVERLASELHPHLVAFDKVRERHSLVCKRFDVDETGYDHLRERLRVALSPTPAFEVRITGIDAFETPIRGPAPVVYLDVESPGLYDLHHRIVEEFGVVDEELEGPGYTPHVTLARGGNVADVDRLRELDIDPVTWTVSEVDLWSQIHHAKAWTVSLPRP